MSLVYKTGQTAQVGDTIIGPRSTDNFEVQGVVQALLNPPQQGGDLQVLVPGRGPMPDYTAYCLAAKCSKVAPSGNPV